MRSKRDMKLIFHSCEAPSFIFLQFGHWKKSGGKGGECHVSSTLKAEKIQKTAIDPEQTLKYTTFSHESVSKRGSSDSKLKL